MTQAATKEALTFEDFKKEVLTIETKCYAMENECCTFVINN